MNAARPIRSHAVLLACLVLLTACSTGPGAAPSASTHWPAHWQTIGRSRLDRPIEAVTIGQGPKRVLLIAGIHGNETEAQICVDMLVGALADAPATSRLVRDMNPDGAVARTRANAAGVDLNRNWPASNYRPGADRGSAPLSEPETRAVSIEMDLFDPDLVIVLHSTRAGPFVNFDGPARHLAEAFARGASEHGGSWRVVSDMGYPTPGSLGTYVGVDQAMPILTVELARGRPGPCTEIAAGLTEAIAAIHSLP